MVNFDSDGVRELPHVRINSKWYYQDNRLKEFRNVRNPHERITFEEFRGNGFEIEETKTFVGNFVIGEWALDIKCRCKGHRAYVMNIGRGHWGVCDKCKACIFLGSNLISAWRDENEKIWRARSKRIEDYKHYV